MCVCVCVCAGVQVVQVCVCVSVLSVDVCFYVQKMCVYVCLCCKVHAHVYIYTQLGVGNIQSFTIGMQQPLTKLVPCSVVCEVEQ